MSDLEDDGGTFCFNCAVKALHDDPPQPEPLHNPWPQLIRSKALDHTFSQPLICAMYTAAPWTMVDIIEKRRRRTLKGKPTREDIIDFYDWYTYLHETAHLGYLHWTPAKELAKLCLSLCYDMINQLLFDVSSKPKEEIWKEFIASTDRLSTIGKSIGFVEELIATALSLNAMELQTLPGKMWAGFQEELEMLKQSALANEEKNPNFRDFSALHGRIFSIIKLLHGNFSLAASLLPLFQPVIDVTGQEKEGLAALDARRHLDVIFTILDGCTDADSATRRLQLAYEGGGLNAEMEAWKAVLATQLTWIQQATLNGSKLYPGTFTQKLWSISWSNTTREMCNEISSSREKRNRAQWCLHCQKAEKCGCN